MKHWEINGNLNNKDKGISNYERFQKAVSKTKDFYDKIFGIDIMNRIDFYVDNATSNSGYVPISTPVLGEIIVIKLGIYPNDSEAQIAFQFAHELTHVVFWAYFGMCKPKANDEEETICTAASLIVIKALYPELFQDYERSVKEETYVGYQRGAQLAATLAYDMDNLRTHIENFEYSTMK